MLQNCYTLLKNTSTFLNDLALVYSLSRLKSLNKGSTKCVSLQLKQHKKKSCVKNLRLDFIFW